MGTCSAGGIWTTGDGFLDTTSVAADETEPEGSVATIVMGTPKTSPEGTSACRGIPNIRRAPLSIDSQSGGFDSVYVIGESEEKVLDEKTNSKGSPMRAIGGTWELMGNETVGAASHTVTISAAIHSLAVDGAIF